MTGQIYAKRGELICIIGQKPPMYGSRIKASVFWLGKEPFSPDKPYKSSSVLPGRVAGSKAFRVLNASTLEATAAASSATRWLTA